MNYKLRVPSEMWMTLAIFGLLLFSYVYVFPRWADPNQDSRLKMVVAVVDDGTFQIDRYLGTTVDYAKVNGHFYSDKAPGVAFLGIPVYALLQQLPIMDVLAARLENSAAFQGTLRTDGSGVNTQKVRFALAQVAIAAVVGALPTALVCAFLYLWLTGVTPGRGIRLAVVLGYGLLTPAFAYANTLYGHQLSAALLFGAFYGVSTARRWLSTSALLAIGVLLALAVVTEYPAAVIAGILYLYTAYRLFHLRQPWGLAWVSLSAGLVAAGWMAYNNAIFGGPLNLGYNYSELWQTQHHTGFMSLTLPSLEALWGLTFGLFRGVFVLAPWLLLALPGFWQWWRAGQARAEWVVAVTTSLGIYLFNASSGMWWGGFAVGPRYLLPMLPFFVLGSAFAFRTWQAHQTFKLLTALTFAWSLVATWGLTLAEQAFPPDTLLNPLIEYALPNWLAGNVARNLGTLLSLRGPLSLLPLTALWIVAAAWYLRQRGAAMAGPLPTAQLANHEAP